VSGTILPLVAAGMSLIVMLAVAGELCTPEEFFTFNVTVYVPAVK
jgi:hypothetical protein